MFRTWRRQPRQSALHGRSIDDLIRSVALNVEPTALRASIAARVRELIGCESVVICGWRAEVGAFVADPTPDGFVLPPAFSVTGSLAKWLEVNREPLTIPHPSGAFEYLDAPERAVLGTLHARACVPVLSGSKTIAILVVAHHDVSWSLAQGDAELLMRIGRQAALALENAELQHSERERLRNLSRAEQLVVAGQLAATIAHEVRNPLTTIRSTIQYTLSSKSDWATKERLLGELLGEVDRIERTVSEVLALARPQESVFAEIDLIEVVTQALLLVQAYARAHDITIRREFEVDAIPIRGDQRSLHQVCLNILLNACQAMPHGGTIVLRCTVSVDRRVGVLQIRDTGCGISPEHQSRVFDPFFTTKSTGTGLGLPICLDIVTKHEGQLRLESQVDHGTVVIVSLPLR